MRRKRKEKNLFLFILIVFTLVYNIPNEYVEAFRGIIPLIGFGGGGGTYEPPQVDAKVNDTYKINCEYEPNYWNYYNQQIDINAYDMEGNSIVPYSHISLSKFKAGTWIGINLREFKATGWNIEVDKYNEIYKQYYCGWGFTAKGLEEYNSCVDYNTNVYPKELQEYQKKVSDCQEKIAKCKSECEEGKICKCTCNPGNAPKRKECHTCTDGSINLPYYYEENNTITADLCWPEKTSAINLGQEPKPIDHSGANCEPKSIRYVGESEPQELVGLVDLKKRGCNAKAVQEGVKGGLSLLYPSLQFEIINPNNYNQNNIETLVFDDTPEIIRQDETITLPDEPEPLIVSEDERHIRTFKPENIEKYIEGITLGNYTSYMQKNYWATYEYTIDNTCIDVKNSNVYYGDTCNSDSANIKKIENGVTKDQFLNADIDPDEDVNYWHYFIPLDTNTSKSESNDVGFFMRISTKRSNPIETENCITVLDLYKVNKEDDKMPNYMNFITPVSPNDMDIDFVGDYIEGEDNENSRDMKLFTEQNYKCKFSIKVKFNIEQKFYGEEESHGNLKIKGYGFYYRTINPNEPFPNEIASDSIWLGLYSDNKITVKNKDNSETRTINLDDSFSSITYTTQEVSLNEVRQATKKSKEYTNWKEMNLDGTSQFITSFDLRRDVSLENIYALGCGPDNLDWEGCE